MLIIVDKKAICPDCGHEIKGMIKIEADNQQDTHYCIVKHCPYCDENKRLYVYFDFELTNINDL